MNKITNSIKVKKLVLTGLLFAMALILSLVESMLPPLIPILPIIKIGLSNIIVMYALFFIDKKSSYEIAVLKSLFVFITRGSVSAFLSLMGGLISITAMIILLVIFKSKITYFLLSIAGAIMHNIGQLIAIFIVYQSFLLISLLPVLILAGLFTGIATAILLKLVIPAIKKVNFNKE